MQDREDIAARGEAGSSSGTGPCTQTGTQKGGRWGPCCSLTGFALDVQGQRDALVDESHDLLEILLVEVAGCQCRGTWGQRASRAPSALANPNKGLPQPWPLSEPETGSKVPCG